MNSKRHLSTFQFKTIKMKPKVWNGILYAMAPLFFSGPGTNISQNFNVKPYYSMLSMYILNNEF